MKFLLSFITFLLCCCIIGFGGYQTIAESDFDGMIGAFEEAITSNPILPQKPVGPENPVCEEHVDKNEDYLCDNCGELVGLPENTQKPGDFGEPEKPADPDDTTKPSTPSNPTTTTKPTTSTTTPTTSTTKPTTVTRPTSSTTKPTTVTRPTSSTTNPTTVTRPTTSTTGSTTNNNEPNPPVDEPCFEHVDYDIDNICDVCGTDLAPLVCLEHIDYNNDYYCDSCGTELEAPCVEHVDANLDYFCDYCATELERPCVDHEDNDGNYYCDYCATILEHEEVDSDSNHKCDVCGAVIEISVEESTEDVKNYVENFDENNASIANKPLIDALENFLDGVLGDDWVIPGLEHTCESVCDKCGKCVNYECTEFTCSKKCEGHIPPHSCESICQHCGKCLDKTCGEVACAVKCKGHAVAPNPTPNPEPVHTCENKCEKCGKCLNLACVKSACDEKCEGHEPDHVCESVCDECGKCLDMECEEAVCNKKCKGHESNDDFNSTFDPDDYVPEEDEDDEPVKIDYQAMIKEVVTLYAYNMGKQTAAFKQSLVGKTPMEQALMTQEFSANEAAGKTAFMNIILLTTSESSVSNESILSSVKDIMKSTTCMITIGEINDYYIELVEGIQYGTRNISEEAKMQVQAEIQAAYNTYINTPGADMDYAQNYKDLANFFSLTID